MGWRTYSLELIRRQLRSMLWEPSAVRPVGMDWSYSGVYSVEELPIVRAEQYNWLRTPSEPVHLSSIIARTALIGFGG